MNPQTRITLKSLTTIKSMSQETLCFTAKMYFDGKAIAEVMNGGWGGETSVMPLAGMKGRVEEAESYAQSLPPLSLDTGAGERSTINMTLDMLVDDLAEQMEVFKTLRRTFNSLFLKRVMYICNGRLMEIPKLNLMKCKNRAEVFSNVRKKNGDDIVILSELPKEVAFKLFAEAMTK